jgi:hypothetical protein
MDHVMRNIPPATAPDGSPPDELTVAGGRARPDWVPAGIDLERPNAARIYDYYLGGAHNFAVDRRLADEAIAAWPELPAIMQANRSFLRRAVRFLADAGIRQFLDLGSGMPTVGNVHAVAQQADPSCRIAYVDNDPVVVTHSRAILRDCPGVATVQADLRHPAKVLSDPQVLRLLDLSEPVALLAVAVLHFIPDGDCPREILAGYRDAVATGSYLALCHASPAERPVLAAQHVNLYTRTATPMTMRPRTEIAGLLDGWEPVDPGLVLMTEWRPDSQDTVPTHPEDYPGYAAVARKP